MIFDATSRLYLTLGTANVSGGVCRIDNGGTGSNIKSWTINNTNPWVTFNAGTNGSGSATVLFTVSPNPNPGARVGFMTVAMMAGMVVASTLNGRVLSRSGKYKKVQIVGLGAAVLQGRRVGCNVVIGAGAVVVRDVLDDVVVTGVPARVLKARSHAHE